MRDFQYLFWHNQRVPSSNLLQFARVNKAPIEFDVIYLWKMVILPESNQVTLVTA